MAILRHASSMERLQLRDFFRLDINFDIALLPRAGAPKETATPRALEGDDEAGKKGWPADADDVEAGADRDSQPDSGVTEAVDVTEQSALLSTARVPDADIPGLRRTIPARRDNLHGNRSQQ